MAALNTRIVSIGGAEVRVKGTPEEVRDRFKSENDYLHIDGRGEGKEWPMGLMPEPGFVQFEAAESRQEIRVRPAAVFAIIGVGNE